jgi:hypothetical protein
MKRSTFMSLLLLALTLLSTAISTNAQRPVTIQMYAAKFVCGKSDNRIVAPGEYFTAINVHNPSVTTRAVYIKRFAIALPEERPGKISEFVSGVLGPDEAMGIDCQNIYKHTGTSPGQFLEGYALLYSLLELDVVSIYTAGHSEVETLHTERVPVRKFVIGRQHAMSRRLMEQ